MIESKITKHMKRTTLKGLAFLATAFLLIAISTQSCSTSHTWTPNEEALRNDAPGTKMRLWTIDNAEDSIFLRQPSQPLTQADIQQPIFELLKERMLLTVTDPENEGVGIAAPQVGIGRQVVAVQRFDKPEQPFEFYVNPCLTYLSDEKQKGWEGCLSVPNQRGEVMRSKQVVVTFNHPNTFELQCDTIEGFTAIIFQHEIDHLSGTLYIDKAETLK